MAIRVRPGTKNNPSKKGYYTIEGDTPEDVQKMRGSDIVKQLKQKGVSSLEKQMDAQRQGEDVRYPNGMKLRLPTGHAEDAVAHMRRVLPGGPPAVRTTISIGARIVTDSDGTKRVVRD